MMQPCPQTLDLPEKLAGHKRYSLFRRNDEKKFDTVVTDQFFCRRFVKVVLSIVCYRSVWEISLSVVASVADSASRLDKLRTRCFRTTTSSPTAMRICWKKNDENLINAVIKNWWEFDQCC